MPFHSIEYVNTYGDTTGEWSGETFVLRAEHRSNDTDNDTRAAFIHVLGYCKIGDTWRIAVKKGLATTIGKKENSAYEWEESQPRYPLLEASRTMRLKALGAMDRLFKIIEEKLDEMLKSIENGKKFLRSIE